MTANVSPKEWRAMCARSADLLAQAELAARIGLHDRASKLWSELRPLNLRIRRLATMPPDGSPPRSPAPRKVQPFTEQQVAEIAEGLTKAQLKRIIGMKRRREVYREPDWTPLQELHAMKLISYDWRVPYLETEYQMSAGLSNFGLAVRAHLERQQ